MALHLFTIFTGISKSANCYLHCIKKIRRFLSRASLVHCLVMIRLDYSNAVLCGASDDVIRQLKRVQRRADRVVCRKYNNYHN